MKIAPNLKLRTVRWQRREAIIATYVALIVALFSWQFALGMVCTAWLFVLDHARGKSKIV